MNETTALILIVAILALWTIYCLHWVEKEKRQTEEDEKKRAEKEALLRDKEAKAEKERAKERKRSEKVVKKSTDSYPVYFAIDQKLARLEEYEKALTFSTYELAEIVINLVDCVNYDKLKEVASVLSDQMHVDEVLVEASKKLSNGYESAIKEISDTRCVDIDYSEKEVLAKLESLVDSCIAIGTGAIGKKIGLSASSRGSSSSKGEIRKTKKWKDD